MTADLFHIQISEKTIADDLCQRFITAMESISGSLQEMNEDWRRCSLFPVELLPQGTLLFEEFKAAIKPAFNAYKQHFSSGVLNFCTLIERPNIIRYVSSSRPQHFHEHADSWNVDSATRQVSIIAYLNDVEEGGATVFPQYKTAVKPSCGSVLFFPSAFTHIHRADPPISGNKYVIVTWLHFGGEGVRYQTTPF